MKLVLFESEGSFKIRPGVLVEDNVADISHLIEPAYSAQIEMQTIIDQFDALRKPIEAEIARGVFVEEPFRLHPPLPRPGKILGCIGNYWEHAQRDPRELNMFLKNSDAVVGPGDTIQLPLMTEPWIFMHEAELAIVIKGPAKNVAQENWKSAVFGYTCLIDVSARGKGRYTWKEGSWLGKSFDTFAPIGPCITTADEIPDPNNLIVRFWVDGQLRHNYSTDDMEHRVPELVAFATSIMTMNSGDVISCGTNHEGLGPIQDGESLAIEIGGIGRMTLDVNDPLKRVWEKGIYMGEDSTNHDAVKRHRPFESKNLHT